MGSVVLREAEVEEAAVVGGSVRGGGVVAGPGDESRGCAHIGWSIIYPFLYRIRLPDDILRLVELVSVILVVSLTDSCCMTPCVSR